MKEIERKSISVQVSMRFEFSEGSSYREATLSKIAKKMVCCSANIED